MATSGTTAWSLTARDIITEALRENAIIGFGDTPTTEEADACLVRLNGLLKSWGCGEHLERTDTITVTADTATVTLNANIADVRSARVVESATYERQMARWERDEYLRLPNKASSGSPTCFYADNQLAATVLYVWPVPTANTSVKIDVRRHPETVTALSQTVDFPEEHQETLYANLAVRCAGIFGVQPSQELYTRAEMLRREYEDESRPASYFMEAYG